MKPAAHPLPPSSSLPPLRTLDQLTESQVASAIQSLSTIYCSLPISVAFQLNPDHKFSHHAASVVDSGYVSETDDDHEEIDGVDHHIAALRADLFERSFAERWLTGFIARAETLSCFTSEDACQLALEQASCVLESFFAPPEDDDDQDESDNDYTRDFSFQLLLAATDSRVPVTVRLNDRLAGTNSADPDDVGLQSWGASIVLSDLMCADPARFGLTQPSLGSSPRIIELGAGTGLVSLALGKMLPHLGASRSVIVATDYHPAVLANLKSNISINFPSSESSPVQMTALDWSAPVLEAPLDVSAQIIIATDVIYAPEHATWLRDCATQLLAPDGVFWLLVTVRWNGKFNGVSDTVEGAFTAVDRPRGKNGKQLTALYNEIIEKRSGVGRGDESGYKLLKIGWA
ncbi:s-adenosylmethionine-dependent methyltransferase [Colletotrichum truncatum]|uniref:S-adenosylmethionine-dependent methyltransferase n=1 Tax=Colletotrichum truncatum TaxID=5467 RepID=A0ACC3YS14_COLTU|nr:s-adenosylmethionine-dependent methyltransferase [Colletotrichum truncatum]KAF6799369.1 s-adenosylmethionine-dependent methyltransferase [Colletotrichum truncatum]